VTLDLGASWIHGIRNNPIHELAQQNKIKTFPTDSDKHWLYRDDHEYEDAEQGHDQQDQAHDPNRELGRHEVGTARTVFF
jgi:hypothetical protein